MSKITFRADDALVERLDGLDASKSEVMREALREFLDRHPSVEIPREVTAESTNEEANGSDDERETIQPELNVNITLDGAGGAHVDGDIAEATAEKSCKQCGETMSKGDSFCPNCGEEHRRHPHCECGEEIRSDWAFCPGCGRRSPTTEMFDRA